MIRQACSLVYTLMYRCGDEVIFPLVQLFGVERALASLLDTRRNDLSFDQVTILGCLVGLISGSRFTVQEPI